MCNICILIQKKIKNPTEEAEDDEEEDDEEENDEEENDEEEDDEDDEDDENEEEDEAAAAAASAKIMAQISCRRCQRGDMVQYSSIALVQNCFSNFYNKKTCKLLTFEATYTVRQ